MEKMQVISNLSRNQFLLSNLYVPIELRVTSRVRRATSDTLRDRCHPPPGFFSDSILPSLAFHVSARATQASFLWSKHMCTVMNGAPQKDVSCVT